ncbi:hypothetical protein OBBRIDRAFT_518724 [Obba rivulosa]|uniref:Uncharacterized protein n=1 Tax=Obba rivulosa TaxID=1052685 RepID=A0A8E2DDF9_9APHY|nr:hypothetical protein OBBRIDRAFT_518724 [Obba rivulosa]
MESWVSGVLGAGAGPRPRVLSPGAIREETEHEDAIHDGFHRVRQGEKEIEFVPTLARQSLRSAASSVADRFIVPPAHTRTVSLGGPSSLREDRLRDERLREDGIAVSGLAARLRRESLSVGVCGLPSQGSGLLSPCCFREMRDVCESFTTMTGQFGHGSRMFSMTLPKSCDSMRPSSTACTVTQSASRDARMLLDRGRPIIWAFRHYGVASSPLSSRLILLGQS